MNISEKLFINNVELSGRLILPPMATKLADARGHVTAEMLEYYSQRAEHGHFSMIITEHCYVDLSGRAHQNQLSIADDSDVEGLKRLVDTIHSFGVKALAQISHAGFRAKPSETGIKAYAPSVSEYTLGRENEIYIITPEDISFIAQKFAAAAVRAKAAGYDAVEIHSAHSYLLNQFYSPLSNKRSDEYGRQTLENALRAHMQVISAVKETVGESYPVGIRLGACDYTEGGSTIEDGVNACIMLEKAGLAFIDISGGFNGFTRKDTSVPGYFRDMTEPVKKAVSIPVILTGGVTAISEAECLLMDNACDLVGIGRAAFKNAKWYE